MIPSWIARYRKSSTPTKRKMKEDDSTIRDFYEATDNAAKIASKPTQNIQPRALHGLLKKHHNSSVDSM